MRKFFFHIMQFFLIWRRNRTIAPAIKSCTIIGDFGCGHYVNRFATVRIDKIDTKDEQRGFLSLSKEPIVNWDLNQYPWPFPDKHFDFAICTHVLEHLKKPERACAELSRVARAGYIEVPYWCVDAYIRNTDSIHESLCSVKDGVLKFWDRKKFLVDNPPCTVPIITRFLMQIRNEIRILWSGEVKVNK